MVVRQIKPDEPIDYQEMVDACLEERPAIEPIGSIPDPWPEMNKPPPLEEILADTAALKEEIQLLELAIKQKQVKFQTLSQTILKSLELMEVDQLRAHGFLFYKETKTSVTTPKTPEEKKLLFDYLEERGILLEMASVNSQTLNKLYKDFADEAAKQGVLDFRLPGVPEPTIYTNLKMRRS